MFDNTHSEMESFDRKQYSNPSFIQRSVSAPAIAEHVSEALLPAYNYEDDDDSVAAGVTNNPSRMNPRMPNLKKGDNSSDLDSSYSELFEEGQAVSNNSSGNKASLLSLISDPLLSRTPMDLIQADFPSTPSAVYSNRIFESAVDLTDTELMASVDGSTGSNSVNSSGISSNATEAYKTGNLPLASSATNVNPPTIIPAATAAIPQITSTVASIIPTLGSPTVTTNVADSLTGLEQATKSLEQLYVNPEKGTNAAVSTQQPAPLLLSQYHTPLHATAGHALRTTSAFFPNGAAATTVAPASSTAVKTAVGGASTSSSSVVDPMLLNVPTAVANSNSSSNSILGVVPSDINANSSSLFRNIIPSTAVTAIPIAGVSKPSIQQQQLNNYNTLLGNNPSSILNNGLNPLTPAIGMGNNGMTLNLNGTSNMLQQQQQQQQHPLLQQQLQGGNPMQQPQPAYYVQQAVYLDQNGQPMFYRPASIGNNQYGGAQDFMYNNSSNGTLDVNQLLGLGNTGTGTGDQQQQGSFMQFPSGMAVMNPQGGLLPGGGYWAPTSADGSGGNMFMSTQQQQLLGGAGGAGGLPVVGMNSLDGNRRMVFNPTTGQYTLAAHTLPGTNNNNNSLQSANRLGGNITSTNNNNAGGNNAGTFAMVGPSGMLGNSGVGGINLIPALLPRNNQQQGNNSDNVDGMFSMNSSGNNNNSSNSNNNSHRDDDLTGGRNNYGSNNNSSNSLSYMDYGGNRERRGGSNMMDNSRDRDNNYNNNNSRDNYRDNRNDRDNRSNNNNNRDRDRDRDRNGRNDRNNSSGMNPVRDSLVEEFRSTYGKSRQWGLRDLIGHVVAFCQDQHGSRFIQQRLEVCNDADKQLIFDEIMPSAQSLMTDVFGNYVLQKLFEYGTGDQCEGLALLLKGQSVQLAMQMYGCRVVQKALEYVNTARLIELVAEFENPPLLLRCVHDSNGNHVIQKCIEIVSKASKEAATPEAGEYLCSRIQFIISAFQGRVKELSSHPYGCRVVQRILEHCSNSQKAVVLEELRQCCTELVQDCYGNYVIQFVMQHGWEADRAVLIREVQSNLLDFSQHKFASNVVEKCLQFASKKDRDEMIWTIINVTFDLKSPVDAKGHCVLESMVRDPYANYVVQKVIDVSDDRQRAAIMRYVKENITQLRRYTYGKHIIVRLEKITNEKF